MTKLPANPDARRGVGPIDTALGSSIRAQRSAAGISQKFLASEIGVTIQQVYCYEHGLNKLSISQLIEIAKVLNCRVGNLIADFDPTAGRSPVHIQIDLTGASELLATYSAMPDNLRHAISDLLVCAEKFQFGRPRRLNRRVDALSKMTNGQRPR